MSWKIGFYNKKVEESIREWPVGVFAKFLWLLSVIKQFGPHEVGMPHIKVLGKGLFEIRVKAHEAIGRALFCTIQDKGIIILNGFIKKTQKTPAKELDLAYKRIKEIKENV